MYKNSYLSHMVRTSINQSTQKQMLPTQESVLNKVNTCSTP